MKCSETTDRLGEWLVEALSVEEQAAVSLHVRECPACAGEVQELRTLEGRLRGLPLPSSRGRKRWMLAVGPAVAAAALLAILGVILIGPPASPGRQQDVKAGAREMVLQFERLGEALREAYGAAQPASKPLVERLDALRRLADEMERRVPEERLRTIRGSCRVIEMLLWEFPEARKRIEGVRTEFTEEEWKEIAAVYLAESFGPKDLEALTTGFFRRGRDAAAALADDPSPGIEIRLSVWNAMKRDGDKIRDKANYRITWPKGAESGEVRYDYGAVEQPFSGGVTAGALRSHVAELRDRGLLTLRDASTCKCDAPQYKVTATVGEKTNTFHLGHAHTELDQPHRELVEAVIRFVEAHAKPAPRK